MAVFAPSGHVVKVRYRGERRDTRGFEIILVTHVRIAPIEKSGGGCRERIYRLKSIND